MAFSGSVGPLAGRRTMVVLVLGGVASALVRLLPDLRLGYRSADAHVALEVSATLTCALVAFLLYGRYRRTHRLRELLLVYAMALLCLTALVFVARPALIGHASAAGDAVWVALLARLVAAVLIVTAALLPATRVHRPAQPLREVLDVAGLFTAIAVFVIMLGWQFPGLVDANAWTEGSGRPVLAHQPLLLAVQLIALPCYALAAWLFTREAARGGDELVSWFGAAAAMGAWVRLNYLLWPTLYTDWLSLGDVLQLGFFALLFIGAVREIHDYWGAQAVAVALTERRRLARDLHDGVVQELGYIRSRAASLSGSRPDGFAAEIVAAADRALSEARLSIDALTADRHEDLSATLERAAAELGDRYDVSVHRSLEPEVSATEEQREALLRIMGEAVLNSARHAPSAGVWVTLADHELTVRDDGFGFVEGLGRRGSFGLTGMRERAVSVGAAVEVTSVMGQGTTVRATW